MPGVVSCHGEATPARVEVRFEPMQATDLDGVLAIEQSIHPHPWLRRNFEDVLCSGYQAQMLMGADQVLGYFVAMQGVDEVHLLNLSVALPCQGQGWARVMLDALDLWGRGHGACNVWLEVRQSNVRAQHVYAAHGFQQVGVRKAYYPASEGQREDALVMCCALTEEGEV